MTQGTGCVRDEDVERAIAQKVVDAMAEARVRSADDIHRSLSYYVSKRPSRAEVRQRVREVRCA